MRRDAVAAQIGDSHRASDLLDLLLGYQSTLERVRTAASRPGDRPPSAPDAPLVLALLGVLSLEAQAARFVRHALAGADVSDQPTGRASQHPPSGEAAPDILR